MASAMPTPDPAEIEQELRAATLREVELRPKDFLCRLIRLNTDDYVRLGRNSYPITDDYSVDNVIMGAHLRGERTLNLAEVFVTLELLC